MRDDLNRIFFGNTVFSYLLVATGIIVAWVVWKLIRRSLIKALAKVAARTRNTYDDLLVEAAEKFAGPFLYLIVNYTIIRQLQLTLPIEKVLSVAVMIVTIYFAARTLNFIIYHLIVTGMKARNESEQRIRQVQGLLGIVRVIVWGVGLVMFIDNLGYNVTTIIAGLGVGGIAIALAAQNILTDLFSYLVIFFDKPFETGDFIITGQYSGIVEKIGIKTSNIRSLDGQQLVMPNTELVKSVIQNYKRLERRRVVFSIGIVYQTPVDLLRVIPSMIKQIIEKEPHVSFDRANFRSFDPFSISYEIVYYIDSPDYILYMNTQEEICMKILETFRDRDIEFAFPTQTVYLEKQPTGQD